MSDECYGFYDIFLYCSQKFFTEKCLDTKELGKPNSSCIFCILWPLPMWLDSSNAGGYKINRIWSLHKKDDNLVNQVNWEACKRPCNAAHAVIRVWRECFGNIEHYVPIYTDVRKLETSFEEILGVSRRGIKAEFSVEKSNGSKFWNFLACIRRVHVTGDVFMEGKTGSPSSGPDYRWWMS